MQWSSVICEHALVELIWFNQPGSHSNFNNGALALQAASVLGAVLWAESPGITSSNLSAHTLVRMINRWLTHCHPRIRSTCAWEGTKWWRMAGYIKSTVSCGMSVFFLRLLWLMLWWWTLNVNLESNLSAGLDHMAQLLTIALLIGFFISRARIDLLRL